MESKVINDFSKPGEFVIDGLQLACTCVGCPEQYDVYRDAEQPIAYLRLRHGHFTVEVPDCGGEMIFESSRMQGDGRFEPEERQNFLQAAVDAIRRHYCECDPETCHGCGGKCDDNSEPSQIELDEGGFPVGYVAQMEYDMHFRVLMAQFNATEAGQPAYFTTCVMQGILSYMLQELIDGKLPLDEYIQKMCDFLGWKKDVDGE